MRKRLAKQLIKLLFKFNNPFDMLRSLREFARDMEFQAIDQDEPGTGWEKIGDCFDQAYKHARTFQAPWKSLIKTRR